MQSRVLLKQRRAPSKAETRSSAVAERLRDASCH